MENKETKKDYILGFSFLFVVQLLTMVLLFW